MKLEDAIKSGKAIRRKDSKRFDFYIPIPTKDAEFSVEDVLADWEVEEEKILITADEVIIAKNILKDLGLLG